MNSQMTSRERVIAAIEFSGPDRLPHRHCYLPAALLKYPQISRLYKKYPSDFAGEHAAELQNTDLPRPYRIGEWEDEWHCGWTVMIDGLLGQVTRHPLADLSLIQAYEWPDPRKADIGADLALSAGRGARYTVLGGLTLFERMVDLRGFESLMLDIAEGRPELIEMRDRVLAFNLGMIDRLLDENPDCINLADDWGSQISLMISPDIWKELFLPAYRKMFSRIRDAGKHVFFHSDGYTIDILPDLVDAGANVLWVDLTVNPLERLRRELGGKVCFQGLTDVQFTLSTGTPEEVDSHARELVENLASFNGGFIACSELDPDQPFENIEAVLDAFYKYGTYPINHNGG